MENTYIIYLIGKPGVGKYTIAQALSNKGFKVCDNHLINNPIFALLTKSDNTPIPDIAWEAIIDIRNAILKFIANEPNNSYVLTNCLYDNEEDKAIYNSVKQTASKRRSIFIPVKLLVSPTEHLNRVTQPERRIRFKCTDPSNAYDATPLLHIMHPNLLQLDISELTAIQAAEQIINFIQHKKPILNII
jgi:hypothetical protein